MLSLLIVSLLSFGPKCSDSPIAVMDEGAYKGCAYSLDFVGSDISCTRSSTTGTATCTVSTGGGGVSTPHMKARRTGSTQTVSHATVTVVVGNTEDWDTDAIHNTGTGVVTIPTTGYYRFIWSVGFTLTNARHIVITGLRINGATYVAGRHVPVYLGDLPAANYDDFTMNGTATLSLTAGDTVELYAYDTNTLSGSVTIRYADDVTFLEVQRVR